MIRCFFLLVLLFPVTRAGASEVLSRRLSVHFHETPVKQALDEVARLADFEWSYNPGILDPGRHVSLIVRDWTVREILREILGENYAFKSNGRYLILKKQKQARGELSGTVRAPSGERLANVTVYDRKTLRATTTDSTGFYQLKVKKKTELVVVRLGYRDTLLQVASMHPRYQNLQLSPVPVPPPDTSQGEKLRQTLRHAATELEHFFAATLNKWHDVNVPDTLHRRFQISLLPSVGSNHVLSGKVENDFSLNVLAGNAAGVNYLEIGGLGNFTRKQVRGVQVAGVFNLNRGNCEGVQVAGVYNQTADTLNGIQVAGLINTARYSPKFSVQAAGLINIIRENAAENEKSAQCVQVSGLLGKAHRLEGVQVSGLVSTAREVDGVQISGLVNHARRARGVQIGLINSAKTGKGIQIGLINRSGKRWLPVINWI
ncbi:MAG: carboxypeptidase-like regulatory domain-containing protein [Saprospiraceae bacterium]|nr:carboxypeptidase-like regulatory domain-containing protein [Saprospiraceae bacterium]